MNPVPKIIIFTSLSIYFLSIIGIVKPFIIYFTLLNRGAAILDLMHNLDSITFRENFRSHMLKKINLFLLISVFLFTEFTVLHAQPVQQNVANDWKLTTVGKIQQLIVNRLRLYSWNTDYPGLIDCEYPPGSGEEHINQTIAHLSGIDPEGRKIVNFQDEMWPSAASWDTIWVVNKWETVDIPYWPGYSAVSDQDFVYRYNDYELLDMPGDEPHIPLHLEVIETAYSWASPPLDEIIVYTFRIIPKAFDVRGLYYTINNTSDIGPLNTNSRLDDRVLYFDELFMEVFEDMPGGRDGDAMGALGFRFLPPKGKTMDDLEPTFIWSQSRGDMVKSTELESYQFIVSSGQIMQSQQNYTGCAAWLSIGPFDVNLGDTLVFRMAEILGESIEGVLQHAEELEKFAALDFKVPSAPPIPPLRVETRSKEISLVWEPTSETNPETYQDPNRLDGIEQPFEGYRVYKSTQSKYGPWNLLAEYDIPNNEYGYNFGLVNEYTDIGLLNNVEYYYSVTAFSKPDLELNWPSQETSLHGNAVVAFPGAATPATVGQIAAVPNPYRGDIGYHAYDPPWEPSPTERAWMEQDRRIQFINLPEHCVIKVYTLTGDYIARIDHRDPVRGYENWNLTSDQGQAIASGLYLFTVEDIRTGDVQVGKFVVIK